MASLLPYIVLNLWTFAGILLVIKNLIRIWTCYLRLLSILISYLGMVKDYSIIYIYE